MSDSPIQAQLVHVLGHLKNPPKDDQGQFGSYTSLPALLDHLRAPLAEVGLGVSQDVLTADLGGVPYVQVTTYVWAESGAQLRFGPLSFPLGPNAQTAGSAITYARRYALCAVFGIAGDTDDDGSATTKQRAAPTVADGTVAGDPNENPAAVPQLEQPTLPVGGGPPDWKAIAQRLTREWKQTVSAADAQQAVVGELKLQGIKVTKPSEVNEDLAHHALMTLIKKGPNP